MTKQRWTHRQTRPSPISN